MYDSTMLSSPAEVVLPDVVQDLRLGQHPVGVEHQVAQELELGRRQLHALAGPVDLVRLLVELEVGEDQAGTAPRRPAVVRRSTARMRAVSSSRLNGLVT
jgi:hypothetical protein